MPVDFHFCSDFFTPHHHSLSFLMSWFFPLFVDTLSLFAADPVIGLGYTYIMCRLARAVWLLLHAVACACGDSDRLSFLLSLYYTFLHVRSNASTLAISCGSVIYVYLLYFLSVEIAAAGRTCGSPGTDWAFKARRHYCSLASKPGSQHDHNNRIVRADFFLSNSFFHPTLPIKRYPISRHCRNAFWKNSTSLDLPAMA